MSVTTADFVDMTALLAQQARNQGDTRISLDRRGLLLALRAVDALGELWQQAIEEPTEFFTQDDDGDDARTCLFEEMLVAELLLRTWCAYVSLALETDASAPRPTRVASAMLITILQQRRRVLMALLSDITIADTQRRLDRVRRLIERWTDVMLAAFPRNHSTGLLCFDASRTAEFASVWTQFPWSAGSHCEPVLLASMRAAIPVVTVQCPKRAAAYRELLGAILQGLGKSGNERSRRRPDSFSLPGRR